jgi:hypothetical protein
MIVAERVHLSVCVSSLVGSRDRLPSTPEECRSLPLIPRSRRTLVPAAEFHLLQQAASAARCR